MKPYYQDDAVTLYLGDCREILPQLRCPNTTYCLEACDGRCEPRAVVTDPVYGISYVHGAEKIKNASKLNGIEVFGDDSPFDPAQILALGHPTILWGANHYATRLPESPGWLVWDKRCNTGKNDQSDCELAWTNILGTARVFYHVWDGFRRDTEKNWPRVHPMQKPVALMTWCLGFVDAEAVVLDPYMGSGPIVEAAKLLGRRAIGIEIEERYCEIAANRLRQEVLPL